MLLCESFDFPFTFKKERMRKTAKTKSDTPATPTTNNVPLLYFLNSCITPPIYDSDTITTPHLLNLSITHSNPKKSPDNTKKCTSKSMAQACLRSHHRGTSCFLVRFALNKTKSHYQSTSCLLIRFALNKTKSHYQSTSCFLVRFALNKTKSHYKEDKKYLEV